MTVKRGPPCALDALVHSAPLRGRATSYDSCSEVHSVDYQDSARCLELARRLHAANPFDRVITQTEAAQVEFSRVVYDVVTARA